MQVGGTPPCLNHHLPVRHTGLAEGPHCQRTRLCAMLGFRSRQTRSGIAEAFRQQGRAWETAAVTWRVYLGR